MANPHPLSTISVEDIEQEYTSGRINMEEKQWLLSEKARLTMESISGEGDDNIVTELGKSFIEEIQKGWDNLKESWGGLTSGEDKEPEDESARAAITAQLSDIGATAYYAGLGVWGMAQVAMAPFNTIGNVAGKRVESLALGWGASPGLAKFLGILADVGTGLIPIGGTARLGAKAVGAVGKAVKGTDKATDAAKGAKEGAEAVAETLTKEEATMQRAIVEGLEADGVKDAAKGMAKAAKAAKKPVAKRSVTEVHDKATSDLGKLANEVKTSRNITKDVKKLRDLARDTSAGKIPLEVFIKDITSILMEKQQGKSRLTKFIALMTEWAPTKMAKGDVQGAVKQFAEDIALLKADEARKFVKHARDLFKTLDNQRGSLSISQMQDLHKGLREAYINSLMPLSWAPSILGNFVSTVTLVTERAIGATMKLPWQWNKGTGYVLQEPAYMLKGMALAIGDAGRAFGKAYQQIDMATMAKVLGVTKADIRKMSHEELYKQLKAHNVNIPVILQGSGKLDFMPGEISGLKGRLARLFGNTTQGVDNFTKVILQRGAEYAWAIRDAVHKGVPDKGAHIAQLMQNKPAEMISEARQLAIAGTFQGELGKFAEMTRKGLQWGPGWLYFPFIKTPIEITKFAWNRTPGLQLISKSLYEDLLAGGTRADAAVGRLILANLLGNFYYEMAKAGMMTGGRPADPEIGKAWDATHEPYSWATSKGFIPYQNMDPATSPAGFMADIATAAPYIDEYSFQQSALAVSLSLMRNVADNVWWQPVSKLLEGITAAARGQEWRPAIRDFLASPITNLANPLLSRTTKIMDPVMRETREKWIDPLLARVPGYSEEVPPRRDGFGDKIIPPQTIGTAWFGYFAPIVPKYKEQTDDWVKLEAERLGVLLPEFPFSVGAGKLPKDDLSLIQPGDEISEPITAKQREALQVFYKNALRHPEMGIEAQLKDNEEYKKANDDLKRQLFEGVLLQAKEMGTKALLVDDEKLGLKVMQNKAKSQIQLMPQPEAEEAKRDLDDAMTIYSSNRPQVRDELLKYGILGEER